MGTESDIVQSPDDKKGKGAVSGFQSAFVHLQTENMKEFCHVVLWTVGSFSLKCFNVFLSLLTPFFTLGVIRLAVGRIRIEKLSLAFRKTQPYSFTVQQHTKDGTIKDLVLSSAPCRLSFSLQTLFQTLKSLCKTEDKAVLAHFCVYEKSNFL